MNEHEATALLEALVEPLEVRTPPTDELLARGRRAQARRRRVTVIGAAAAVAVTMGGIALAVRSAGETSSGPEHPGFTSTLPTPTHPPLRDLDGDQLLGFWEPVTVLGVAAPDRSTVGILQFRRSEVVTEHGCAIFTGRFRLGNSGSVSLGRLDERPMRCPPGFFEESLVPDSTAVLRSATRLQVVDGLLTIFDEDWTELGVYERHWGDVQPGELVGRWAPVELFGHPPSLEGILSPTMPGVRFWEDHYTADDGINETSGAFRVRESGEFDLVGHQFSTLVGCVPSDDEGMAAGQCKKVRNPEVLDVATRVQLLDGLLTFYSAEGTGIGVYHRVR
jgi:hypothetical protein